MNENFEDVLVPGQGIRRVNILDLQLAIGFSGFFDIKNIVSSLVTEFRLSQIYVMD